MSKQEKLIELKFGINLQNRAQSGFFFYNNHRLILMYKNFSHREPEFRGIVGLVDVPYSIMNPKVDTYLFHAFNFNFFCFFFPKYKLQKQLHKK